MRVLAVVLTVLLVIGGLIAAVWLGQTPPPPTVAKSAGGASSESTAKKEGSAPKGTDDDKPIPVVAPHGPYPKAVIGERDYDFGVMEVGGKGSHIFVIRNDGEAPLEVVAREQDTTCQCTVGKVGNEKAVLPGEEVTVELQWEVKSSNPNFRHTAKVRTNDPENQVIELAITGRVDQKFHLVPATVWDLGEGSDDKPARATGALFSRTFDSFEIGEFVCPNPRVTCTWEPLDEESKKGYEAKSGYRLTIDADLRDTVGSFREFVELKSKSPELVAARFEIRARKPGPYEIMAPHWNPEYSTLLLGEFPASEGKSGELTFYTRLDGDVELISAESEHEAVKATWTKDEKYQSKAKTQRYVLKLEVLPGRPVSRKRRDAEKITLKFNHPQLGAMTIFVDYLSI